MSIFPKYVDPATIKNRRHRELIQALIDAELGPRRVIQKSIAEQFGYSPSRVSDLKRLYMDFDYDEYGRQRDDQAITT